MSGWTKLFGSIVTSSVWIEPHPILRVWVAMLAMADANGIVEGSIPGFANLCRVTISEMEDAIEKFSSPDPYSRSSEEEGRRIESIPGGWRIINRNKYRDKGQDAPGSRAAYFRDYRKKYGVSHSLRNMRTDILNKLGKKCINCENDKELQLDHIIPKSKGGTDDIENIQVLCKKCNTIKNNNVAQRITQQKNVACNTETEIEKEKEKRKKEIIKKEKLRYGKFENVLLTTQEKEKVSPEEIEALSEWLESSGKKKKSHYATILTWRRKNGSPPPITKPEIKKIFPFCPTCKKETTKADIDKFGSCPGCFKPLPQDKLKELLGNIGKKI